MRSPPTTAISAWRVTKARAAACRGPREVAESPDDSCIQCHMPRFKMTDIIHTATTDHRVLRNARSAEPEKPKKAGGLPLVLLNGKDETQKRGALDRELAIALATEGPRLHDSPEVREMGKFVLALLDRAIARHVDDLPAWRAKARVLALSGRRSGGAVGHQKGPGDCPR